MIICVSYTDCLGRFDYLDPVILVSEVDGARIISKEKCEFVQKVPGMCNLGFVVVDVDVELT